MTELPILDPRLLEILACPACEDRPPVRLVENGLKCDLCGRIYPIRDGIPEMLVDSAILPDLEDPISDLAD